jgi:hypothetical protein
VNPPAPSIEVLVELANRDAALEEIVQLTEEELALVADGIAALEPPVSAVCRAVLESWNVLDPAERAAGLLVLANALAQVGVVPERR